MEVCVWPQNISNFENQTGLELFSRKGVRIIKGFEILACTKSLFACEDYQFKISAPFMQSPTPSNSSERTEFTMKTQRIAKDQAANLRTEKR